MRRYLYYPGCSLEGTASEYDHATRALMATLGAELRQIDHWTCCGATAAPAVSSLLATCLAARNLALAQAMEDGSDILVPCSACYLNLKKAAESMYRDSDMLARVNSVLAQETLQVGGNIAVRHLLEVLALDYGPQPIAVKVTLPLQGIKVAPYYGCQCLRPYVVFDDPEKPRSMEPLLRAAGAEIFDWAMGATCCGASHMSTKMEVGLTLSGAILAAAQGADVIATVCPMCQMNLEAHQKKMARQSGRSTPLEPVSVVYLPQLLGLAVGLNREQVRLDLNLAITKPFENQLSSRWS